MKNYIKYIYIICFTLLLTGCNEINLTCIKSTTENGITTKENIEIIFKKNKPKQTNILMIMNFNSNTKSKINNTYNLLSTSFKNFYDKNGIEISTTKKDNVIFFQMYIDFKKVNDIKSLGLDFSKKDNLENIQNNFKSDGYICN